MIINDLIQLAPLAERGLGKLLDEEEPFANVASASLSFCHVSAQSILGFDLTCGEGTMFNHPADFRLICDELKRELYRVNR